MFKKLPKKLIFNDIIFNYVETFNSLHSYAKVNSGFSGLGGKTSLHAILDYDDDDENLEDYYDDEKQKFHTHVTPIQGPILLKNGKVPVVPLNSYTRMNNGTIVQIPVSLKPF